MKITYVTEDTGLWGGIHVVFQHLEQLAMIGHEAFLTTTGENPNWYPLKVPLHHIERLDPSLIPAADIVIATSWKTIKPVADSKNGAIFHLCQGYEGGIKEYAGLKNDIDRAYSLIPQKLTTSLHLSVFLKEKFNAETHYIGQMLNKDIFFPKEQTNRDHGLASLKRWGKIASFLKTSNNRTLEPFNILVVGPFEADVKNIATALRGASLASKRLNIPVQLIRASQLPLSKEEEAIFKPDIYHFHIPYPSMGEIYRDADLLVSLSKEAEGFGLPALEAMACGVPTILSSISSHTSFDEKQDYALFVENADNMDIESIAKAIVEIVHNKALRERLIKRGLEVAGKFTKQRVVERLEYAFEEITRRDKLEKTKRSWDNYHTTQKLEQKMYWWDSPVILEHCQRLVTGDPKMNFYQFLRNEFVNSHLQKGLSICSGSGDFERGVIDNNICKSIDAYEIAEERVKEGVRIAKERGYKINFHIEDVNNAVFKHDHYDIFFSWSALHHIENLDGVCKNVKDALKEAGLVVAQEYIGPNQFQWTDRQINIANSVLTILPERLRTDPVTGHLITHIERPSLEHMNRTDPSEAIRSHDIIPTLKKYFEIRMIRYFGGSLYNLLFNNIIGNFDHDSEKDAALIKMILFLEDTLIREKILDNDYAVIIAEKK